MPTRVRGLLLITANGNKYFIEGGIAADRIDNIQLATSPPGIANVVTFTPIANATIQSFQDTQRADWFTQNQIPSGANLGPFIMQAYSVFLERDDDGNDSEVTGNGSVEDPPDG